MHQEDDDDSFIKSRYEKLKPFEEGAKIPAHLLADSSPQEKEIITTLFCVEQETAWLNQEMVVRNLRERELDERVARLENFYQLVRRYKIVITALLSVVWAVGWKLMEYIFGKH
jgi:hypothetical protein